MPLPRPFGKLATSDERQAVNRLFSARVRYIRDRFPNQAQRQRFYQLGLPLRDCEAIEAKRHDLLAPSTSGRPSTGRGRSASVRITWPRSLSSSFCSTRSPPAWKSHAAGSVSLNSGSAGRRRAAIPFADPVVAADEVTAHALSRWMDDVFAYRLPWGLNSLAV